MVSTECVKFGDARSKYSYCGVCAMADESGKNKQIGMAVLALALILAAGALVMWNFEVGPFKKKPVVDVDPISLLTAEERRRPTRTRPGWSRSIR